MKRWDAVTREDHENEAVDSFLVEIVEVCKKHGFSIGHEDRHGTFQIEKFNEENVKWLLDATDCTEISG